MHQLIWGVQNLFYIFKEIFFIVSISFFFFFGKHAINEKFLDLTQAWIMLSLCVPPETVLQICLQIGQMLLFLYM